MPTGNGPPKKQSHRFGSSDAILEGLHGEGLHDLARRLGLHHHHLAEDLALASLSRRLRARLDLAQPRKSEDTSAGHFLARDLRQAADHLRADGLLQLALPM